MKKLLLLLGMITLLFSLITSVEATVIRVPADYSTIQAGLDAASDGDTIQVAQGTYYELLSITKCIALTLEGGWDSSFTSRSTDPSLTIIDGGGGGNVVFISAVSGCDIKVTIDGFTITRGQAFDGAGVHVEANDLGSSAIVSLRGNIITENYAQSAEASLL